MQARGYVTSTETRHVKDAKKSKPAQVKKYQLEHFHNLDDAVIGGIQYKSDCVLCHGSFAHVTNVKVRAFMNAHSWFIQCEVCHAEPKTDEKTFMYSFFDNETNEPVTELKKSSAGGLGTYTARIAVAKKENDTLVHQGVYSGKDFIEKYLKQKVSINFGEIDQGPAMQEVHSILSEDALECDGCHSEEGRIDFQQITYSEEAADHLKSLDVGSMVTTYEEFHFPSLRNDEGLKYRRPLEEAMD